MSSLLQPVAGKLAVESFTNVEAVSGTVVVNSRVFPAVEQAAVIAVVGTVNGLLDTLPHNVWVSGVGSPQPNSITVRAVTSDGDYAGTISSLVILTRRG
ncbi:MAG: hypothetical protein QXE50_05805 [Nitrososphaerota archaeon]